MCHVAYVPRAVSSLRSFLFVSFRHSSLPHSSEAQPASDADSCRSSMPHATTLVSHSSRLELVSCVISSLGPVAVSSRWNRSVIFATHSSWLRLTLLIQLDTLVHQAPSTCVISTPQLLLGIPRGSFFASRKTSSHRSLDATSRLRLIHSLRSCPFALLSVMRHQDVSCPIHVSSQHPCVIIMCHLHAPCRSVISGNKLPTMSQLHVSCRVGIAVSSPICPFSICPHFIFKSTISSRKDDTA